MVTEPTPVQEQDSPPSDFQIHDDTSPVQLEVEAELDAELAQPEAAQVADVDGEKIPLGPDTEMQPPAQPQQQPAGQSPEQPRVYSVGEVAKMQSAWAKQIQVAQQEAQQVNETKAVDQGVEDFMRNQEAKLAPTLGAEEARRQVRSPENEQAVRAQVNTMAENVRLQARITQGEQTREQQAKIATVQNLARQYGLDAEDQQALFNVNTPQAMQEIAARLGAKTNMARSRVPAETPNTALESGVSTGQGAETSVQRLTRVRKKPSWEWTSAEREFMKTGRV